MQAELLKQLEPFADGNWVYEHWPEFHPIADYEQVQQQYLQRCRTFPGVRSVWKVGEVGVPGISDIDFVVGFADPLPGADSNVLSIHHTDGPGPYILFHQPLFLSEESLRNLFIWGSVSTPHCLYGDPTGIQALTAKEPRIMALISLSDIFVQAQPRMLLHTLLTRCIHVRGTLCQINALKHTLRLYREATGLATTEWDGFIEEFAEFRNRWFDLGPDRVDRLRAYIVQSVVMLFELMAAYCQALNDQAWFQPRCSRSAIHFLAPGVGTRFVAHWDCHSALVHTLSEWQRSHCVSLELPLAFLEPLRSYVDQRGPLSSHVKQYLWPNNGLSASLWSSKIALMAIRHVQTRNAHVDFLLRNGLMWNDANFSSLGLWPSILTDRSLRGRLRRPYYQALKWREIARIVLAGSNA